jgi:hypothetical protein
MTNLVFHLGDRKTGSTSIQTTLAAGEWNCATVNLLYPQAERVNHTLLSKSLTEKHAKAQRAPRFREVAAEIAAKSPDVAVISSENFENADPVILLRTLEKFMPEHAGTARCIAYVRPHADRIASSFAEQVKQGHFLGTMAELHQRVLKNARLFYAPRFHKWRTVFGKRFELRPMIREQLLRQDVVADFLSYVLKGAEFEVTSPARSNESLSLEDLAIMRELQKRIGLGKANASPLQISTGWALARQMNALPAEKSTKPRMHRELALAVQAAYQADAAALDAEFFAGTPMTDSLNAAVERSVETEQSVRAEDLFTAGEMRLIGLWGAQMAEMLQADPEKWPRLLRETHKAKVTRSGAAKAAAAAKPPVAAAAKPAGSAKAGKRAGRTVPAKAAAAIGRKRPPGEIKRVVAAAPNPAAMTAKKERLRAKDDLPA